MKKLFVSVAFCFICLSCLFGCALFPSDCKITIVNLNVDGGTATSSEEHKEGEEVTLIAQPNAGYYFSGWTDSEGNVISYATTYTFEVKKSIDLTVNFVKGDSLFISDEKVIFVNNGKFDVDIENETFDIESLDGKFHLGYWYKGTDEGLKSKVHATNIRFRDVKNGDCFSFHEAEGYFYGVTTSNDAYKRFMQTPTKENIESMIDNDEIIHCNTVFENGFNETITVTFDMNLGYYLIRADIYEIDEVETYDTYIGTIYTGVNYTTTYEFTIGECDFVIGIQFA